MINPFDFPGVDNNGDLPEFDMGAYELTPIKAAMKLAPQMLNCKSYNHSLELRPRQPLRSYLPIVARAVRLTEIIMRHY